MSQNFIKNSLVKRLTKKMISKNGLIGLFLILLVTIIAVSDFSNQNDFAKSGGIEYHFLLDLHMNLSEEKMGEWSGDIFQKFESLYQISVKPEPMAMIFYYDSAQRIAMKSNLIFRVSDTAVTVKSRSANPQTVKDLPICSKKKLEVDVFASPEYSISSYINYTKDQFNSNPDIRPSFGEVKEYIVSKCPQIAPVFDPEWDLASVYSPGVVHEYAFPIQLRANHPAIDQIQSVNFSIWFMTPTDKVISELAFTTITNPDESKIKMLREETLSLLKEQGILHPDQKSKTELYFSSYKNSLAQ